MIPFRVLYLFMVAGATAGVTGWYFSQMIILLFHLPVYTDLLTFTLVGLFLGPTVCASEKAWISGFSNALVDAALGLATGLGGGVVGGLLGGLIWKKLSTITAGGDVLVRPVAFIVTGVLLGVGNAFHPFSLSKTVWGMVGGFVGGLIASLLLWVGLMIGGESANVVQAVSLALMGGVIALALHLIVSYSAQAELAGVETNIPKYDERFRSPLYRDMVNIFGNGDFGKSDARANLQLHRTNDDTLDPVHAVLEWSRDSNRYTLTPYHVKMPEATNQGVETYVNGQRLRQPALLKHGDIIQFGKTKFHFLLRHTPRDAE
jgi:hypothetical protein